MVFGSVYTILKGSIITAFWISKKVLVDNPFWLCEWIVLSPAVIVFILTLRMLIMLRAYNKGLQKTF